MTVPGSPLLVLLALAVLTALGVVAYNRPSSLELRVALRYLRSRRSSRLLSLITVIAVGGVTVGVTALVLVLGVMNGLQSDLREKILIASPHLRVLTYGEGLRLDDWERVLAQVRRTSGVDAASPFVLTQGLVSAGHDYAEGVFVLGVDPDTGTRAVTSLARHFTKGDQRFADLDKAVTGLEVRLADPWQARAFGLRLETELGYPYRALDWQSQNASLFSALKLEKLAMAVVVFLICVVAAFNVVGTLTMLVRDKTREIGILLAMGLRRTSIRRIFLAQGILIGLTGTSLGVLLGLVLGGMVNQGQWIHIDPSIYFIDHLPVRTQLVDVFAVIAASLTVATFAPLYPSVQAARLEPVAAIRYE